MSCGRAITTAPTSLGLVSTRIASGSAVSSCSGRVIRSKNRATGRKQSLTLTSLPLPVAHAVLGGHVAHDRLRGGQAHGGAGRLGEPRAGIGLGHRILLRYTRATAGLAISSTSTQASRSLERTIASITRALACAS